MKKTFLLALLLMVATFVFAGGSSESQSASVEGALGSLNSKAGGTLKVLITSDPASLDDTTFRATQEFYFYETILQKDADGEYCGFLIDSYDADIESLTYTFHMKDEPIYFHDGSVMTSEVLAWNINQYKEVGVFASSFNKIDYAEAVDDKTVVIHLLEWDMLLPNCFTRMCKPVSKQFVDQYGWKALASKECGTGPFMLKEWNRDSEVKTVKFKQYHEGEPLLDGINYIIITSAEVALMAYQTGEVDVLCDSRLAYDQVIQLAEDPHTILYTSERGGSAYTLGFHCQSSEDPFYDVRVREAACYAIDTDAIGKAYTEGMYIPGSTQWSANGYPYCSPDVTGFPYDPAKAKELLAEAGYPNGFDTVLYVQTQFQGAAVYVQSYLKKVGINAEIVTIDTANFSTYIGGWGKGMMIHTVGVKNGQEYQLLTAARSDNPSGYGQRSFLLSPELDSYVKQAYNSTVEDSYAPTQRAAKKFFQEDVSAYVLFLTKGWVAAKDYVKDAGICKNGGITMDTLWTAWLDK